MEEGGVAVVYLMAGAGPGSGPRSVRFHHELVARLGKKKPNIAYVGAPSGDNLGFEKMISTLVFGLTAKVTFVRLTKKSVSTSQAKAQLEDADLVFMTGGDVDAGMKVINDRGLAPLFRKLHEQGKPMEGISAGSIMLGQKWVRFHEDESVEAFDCLGVVPCSFDAHDEHGWDELITLAKLLPKKKDGYVCGLVSKNCAVWDGHALHARGGPLHRFAMGTGERLPDLQPA
jgi:peptidase E